MIKRIWYRLTKKSFFFQGKKYYIVKKRLRRHRLVMFWRWVRRGFKPPKKWTVEFETLYGVRCDS
ncbi:MAG: hypothetical protein KGJ13_02065 [Patescibacteria group bacterium]|nr:hypothetical protein [Patescibacteria group bacterium]